VTERLVLIAATLILAIIGLLPIAAMISQTLFVNGTFSLDAYRALFSADSHFALLMQHSLHLSLFTAIISMLIGVTLGVLLGKTDLPFRGAFALLFTAPLLIPPYVLAVAWFSVLGRTGYLGRVVSETWSQQISSAFFGFFGCAFVLATAFTPIAMLLTIAFLRTVNTQLENAGRLVSAWPRGTPMSIEMAAVNSRLADRLCVLIARCRYQHRGLSAGLRYASHSHSHPHG
jgi:iron(III) transport system permease protein